MPYDPVHLFHHNPPKERALRREVFVDRGPDLDALSEDIAGASSPDEVQAIHGVSRVGKSHLVLRFLGDLDSTQWKVIEVPAADSVHSRRVLQIAYEKVLRELRQIDPPQELQPEGVSSSGILAEVRNIAEKYEPLVKDTVDSMEETLTETQEDTETLNLLLKFFKGSVSRKRSEAGVIKATITRPSEERIADLLCEMFDALHLATGMRILFYVDDVDLIDVGHDSKHEEMNRMLECLEQLARCESVSVVTSLRTRHMTIREKGIIDTWFVKSMNDEELRAVFDRHVELFDNRRCTFGDDCIEILITDAAGKPGRLLRSCKKFRNWARRKGLCSRGPLVNRDLEAFLTEEIARLDQSPGYLRYMDQIRAAVQEGNTEVTLDEHVLRTELIYLILDEPPEPDPRTYNISSLAARVISSKIEAEKRRVEGTETQGDDRG